MPVSGRSDRVCRKCGLLDSEGGCECPDEHKHDAKVWRMSDFDEGHDHACCPPDDCCGGPCAAHPCWDLTT